MKANEPPSRAEVYVVIGCTFLAMCLFCWHIAKEVVTHEVTRQMQPLRDAMLALKAPQQQQQQSVNVSPFDEAWIQKQALEAVREYENDGTVRGMRGTAVLHGRRHPRQGGSSGSDP